MLTHSIPTPCDAASHERARIARATGWSVAALVAAPIAWAAVRAAAGSWVPTGDDAYFTVRANDVLTEHHPLVGAWSSGSAGLDTQVNNLGPLQADLLAPFTRWTPYGGTAIGVASVQIVALGAIVWLIARLAGWRAVPVALVPVALLTWTMGSEMLITPRQHQFLILPYLCLLVAAWAATTGDRWALVVVVWSATLVAQTHLSYPMLVAALAVPVVVGQLRAERGTARSPLGIAAASLAVLWVQPLIDQFAGFGNLTAVLDGSGEAGRAGLATGFRICAGVLLSGAAFVRPGYRRFDSEAPLGSAWQVALLAVVIAACGAAAWRTRRQRIVSAGWSVAAIALVAGVIDAAMLPRTRFGLQIMNYRWLWPTAAFVAVQALLAAWRWQVGRGAAGDEFDDDPRRRARLATAAALLVCAAAGVANLPRAVQVADSDRYLAEQRNVATALAALETTFASASDGRLAGGVLIDESAMYFGHPYTYPTMVAMQRHGVEARFEAAAQERRFGAGRLATGEERWRLRLVAGQPAQDLAASSDLVAFVGGERTVAIVLERV